MMSLIQCRRCFVRLLVTSLSRTGTQVACRRFSQTMAEGFLRPSTSQSHISSVFDPKVPLGLFLSDSIHQIERGRLDPSLLCKFIVQLTEFLSNLQHDRLTQSTQRNSGFTDSELKSMQLFYNRLVPVFANNIDSEKLKFMQSALTVKSLIRWHKWNNELIVDKCAPDIWHRLCVLSVENGLRNLHHVALMFELTSRSQKMAPVWWWELICTDLVNICKTGIYRYQTETSPSNLLHYASHLVLQSFGVIVQRNLFPLSDYDLQKMFLSMLWMFRWQCEDREFKQDLSVFTAVMHSLEAIAGHNVIVPTEWLNFFVSALIEHISSKMIDPVSEDLSNITFILYSLVAAQRFNNNIAMNEDSIWPRQEMISCLLKYLTKIISRHDLVYNDKMVQIPTLLKQLRYTMPILEKNQFFEAYFSKSQLFIENCARRDVVFALDGIAHFNRVVPLQWFKKTLPVLNTINTKQATAGEVVILWRTLSIMKNQNLLPNQSLWPSSDCYQNMITKSYNVLKNKQLTGHAVFEMVSFIFDVGVEDLLPIDYWNHWFKKYSQKAKFLEPKIFVQLFRLVAKESGRISIPSEFFETSASNINNYVINKTLDLSHVLDLSFGLTQFATNGYSSQNSRWQESDAFSSVENSILKASVTNLHQCNETELSNLLYNFASLRYRLPNTFHFEWERWASDCISQLSEKLVNQMLSSFVLMNHCPSPKFMQQLLKKVELEIETFHVPTLANLIYALAVLEYFPSRNFTKKWEFHALRSIRQFNPQALANSIYAFTSLNQTFQQPDLWWSHVEMLLNENDVIDIRTVYSLLFSLCCATHLFSFKPENLPQLLILLNSRLASLNVGRIDLGTWNLLAATRLTFGECAVPSSIWDSGDRTSVWASTERNSGSVKSRNLVVEQSLMRIFHSKINIFPQYFVKDLGIRLDFLVMKAMNDKNVAIQIDGPNRFVMAGLSQNANMLNVRTRLNSLLLEQLNYDVIRIPFWLIEQRNHSEKLYLFLKQRLL